MNTNPARDFDPDDLRIEVLSRAARSISVPSLDTAHVVHTARVRRRRRRAAIGSALAVAVFAAGTTVATGAFDPSPAPDAVDAAASLEARYACPDPLPPDSVGLPPTGAVAARMCVPPKERFTRPISEPSAVLDHDIDALFDRTSSNVDPGSGDYGQVGCLRVGGVAYALVIYYPDGDVRTVSGDTGGCGDGGLYDNFFGALEQAPAPLPDQAEQAVLSDAQLQQAAADLVLGAVRDLQGPGPVATATLNDDNTGLVVAVPASVFTEADRDSLVADFEAHAGVPVSVVRATNAFTGEFFGGNTSLAVGATGPVIINTHCGLNYAQIDGRVWETPAIGNGSSPLPAGTGELVVAAVTRTSDEVAVLRAPGLSQPVRFQPALREPTPCF